MNDGAKKATVGGALLTAGLIAGTNATGHLVQSVATIGKAFNTLKTAKFLAPIASIAPQAVIATAAIVGIGYAVKKTYDNWHDSKYHWGEGMDESAAKLKEAADEYTKYSDLSQEVSDLRLVIETPESTDAEIESAKKRLQEIADILNQEYNLKINADSPELEGAVENAREYARNDVVVEGNNFLTEANNSIEKYKEAKEKLPELKKNQEQYKKQYNAMQLAYSEAKLLGSKLGNGSITEKEYLAEIDRVRDTLKKSGIEIKEQGFRFAEHLGNIIPGHEWAIEKYEHDITAYEESIKKTEDAYNSAGLSFTQALSNDVRTDNTEGAEQMTANIQEVGKNMHAIGLNTKDLATNFSIAKQGFTSFDEAMKNGDIGQIAKDYIEFEETIGKTGEELENSVGSAALIKNGFTDVSKAVAEGEETIGAVIDDIRLLGKENGIFYGLKDSEIAPKMTEIARAIGLIPDTKRIEIDAEGNAEVVVDKVATAIEKINGKKEVSLEVNDGVVEVVDTTNEKLKGLSGKKEVNIKFNVDTGGFDITDLEGEIIGEITAEGTIVWKSDTTEVDGYHPENKSANVIFSKDSTEPDSYQPEDKIAYVRYKTIGGSDKLLHPFTGDVEVDGTAHANGTAFANGNWGTNGSGVALGGELCEELVVRDGKFFTIGENSAEFFKYQKGDIIFNADQTKQIFEKGKITHGKRRGKAFAEGNAFADGKIRPEDIPFFTTTYVTLGESPLRTTTETTDEANTEKTYKTPDPSKASSGSGGGSEPDHKDPTEAIINRINLRANELEQQEEYIQNALEIAEIEEEYEKQISLTNDLIGKRKEEIDALKIANSEIHQEAERLRNDTPDWDEETWFDSQGNATEAYVELYNNSSKEVQEDLEEQFERISKLKKAWVENDEKLVDLNKQLVQDAETLNELYSTLHKNKVRDIEHERDIELERNPYFDTTSHYKQLQDEYHKEAERLRALDPEQYKEEIQDLQRLWWDAEGEIAERSYSHSERWINERNTYNDWELYGDDEVSAWERVLERFKTEFPNELEKIKEIEENIFNARKEAMDKSIEDIEEYINARNAYNDWDAYGDSEVKAVQRITKVIEDEYAQRLISREEYIDKLEEQSQRIYSLGQDRVDKHLSNIDKYIDARNLYNDWDDFGDSEIEAIKRQIKTVEEAYRINLLSYEEYTEKYAEYTQKMYSVAKDGIIKEVSELIKDYEEVQQLQTRQLESQKTLLQSYYDVANAVVEAQHEINKELQASMTMHEYLNEETRELLFNQEDYNALNKELLEIQSAADKLQKQYQDDILNANTETIAEITEQYQMQYATMMKQYEIAKAELEVAKKRQQLDNVLAERNTRMFINGQWQWVAKTQDVINAQNELAEAEIKRKKQEASLEQTEAINDFTAQINSLETDLNKTRKWWEDMQELLDGEFDEVAQALQQISEVSSPELKSIIDTTGGDITSFSAVLSEGTTTMSDLIDGEERSFGTMADSIGAITSDLSSYSTAIQSLVAKISGAKESSNGLYSSGRVLKVGADGNAPTGAKIGDTIRTAGGDFLIVADSLGGKAKFNDKSGFWSIKLNADGSRYTSAGLNLMGEEGFEAYISNSGRLLPINQPTLGNIGSGGIVFNREQMANLRNLWDLSNLSRVTPFVSSSNASSQSTVIDNSIHINGMTISEKGNEDWINGFRRYVATHR